MVKAINESYDADAIKSTKISVKELCRIIDGNE